MALNPDTALARLLARADGLAQEELALPEMADAAEEPADAESDSRPALSQKTAELIAKQAKELLMLGVLGELQRLQEEWDPADYAPGAAMPYDPAPGCGPRSKSYVSLGTFLHHEKGLAPVMSITTGAKVGPALFESLLRVLESAPPGMEFGAEGLDALHRALDAPACALGDRRDREIVMQMLLNRRQRRSLGLSDEDRCGGRDLAVLKLMTDHSWPAAAARLERWGLAAAQMFIDYLRAIGEFAMLLHWEKKTTLDEHVVRTALRSIAVANGRRLSEAALGDIGRRTLP